MGFRAECSHPHRSENNLETFEPLILAIKQMKTEPQEIEISPGISLQEKTETLVSDERGSPGRRFFAALAC